MAESPDLKAIFCVPCAIIDLGLFDQIIIRLVLGALEIPSASDYFYSWVLDRNLGGDK